MTLTFLLVFSGGVFAQEGGNTIPGQLGVEFSVDISSGTARSPFSTGYSTIDSLLVQFEVDSLVPVFDAPVNSREIRIFLNLNMDKFWSCFLLIQQTLLSFEMLLPSIAMLPAPKFSLTA